MALTWSVALLAAGVAVAPVVGAPLARTTIAGDRPTPAFLTVHGVEVPVPMPDGAHPGTIALTYPQLVDLSRQFAADPTDLATFQGTITRSRLAWAGTAVLLLLGLLAGLGRPILAWIASAAAAVCAGYALWLVAGGLPRLHLDARVLLQVEDWALTPFAWAAALLPAFAFLLFVAVHLAGAWWRPEARRGARAAGTFE